MAGAFNTASTWPVQHLFTSCFAQFSKELGLGTATLCKPHRHCLDQLVMKLEGRGTFPEGSVNTTQSRCLFQAKPIFKLQGYNSALGLSTFIFSFSATSVILTFEIQRQERKYPIPPLSMYQNSPESSGQWRVVSGTSHSSRAGIEGPNTADF